MRRLFIAAVTVAAMTPAAAVADMPGRGWISAKRATAILQQRGYRVTKIEADDGHWEGEAVRQGRRYDFHVDPRSGRVTKLERDRD